MLDTLIAPALVIIASADGGTEIEETLDWLSPITSH